MKSAPCTLNVTYFHPKTQITINACCRGIPFFLLLRIHILYLFDTIDDTFWWLFNHVQWSTTSDSKNFCRYYLQLLPVTERMRPLFFKAAWMMSGHVLFRCSFLRFFCFLPCHKYALYFLQSFRLLHDFNFLK